MNFKIFLIIYLQLIYTSLANLKLTSEDITLPTKIKVKYIDMMKFDKLVVNDTAPLVLKFTFEAKNSLYEKQTEYFFNEELIKFDKRTDVKNSAIEAKGKKLFQLTFTKFTEKIAGSYLLKIVTNNGSTINATAKIFSPPFLQEFTESKRSTEGGRMEGVCKYFAYPQTLDSLYWTPAPNRKHNYRLTAQNGSSFQDVIVWDILVKADAGYYRCDASNKYGNDSVIMQLRVKDKLAPLWPFIGIVIEIIILLVVIIFYERQKSDKKKAEMDANPSRQSLLADRKSAEVNEGVRQRTPEE